MINKIKLLLIVISPLLISLILAIPYINKSYKNHQDKIKIKEMIKEEEKLNNKKIQLLKEKDNLDNKLSAVLNEKQKQQTLIIESNGLKDYISKINKQIKGYNNKIASQKNENEKIKKYVP